MEKVKLHRDADKVAADPAWYELFDREGLGVAYQVVAYDVRGTN